MAATDVPPNRLQAASDQVIQMAADLPSDVPVTLIGAGQEGAGIVGKQP